MTRKNLIDNFLLISIMAILVYTSCNSDDKGKSTNNQLQNEDLKNQNHSDTNNKNSSKVLAIKDSTNQNTNWGYSSEQDRMEGKSTYEATNYSTDFLYFKYGTSILTLNLRYGFHGKGNEVYLSINHGQFVSSSSFQSKSIKVKFDDKKSQFFRYIGTSSGDTRTIFLLDPNSCIKKLKNSKHLIIETEYFDDGFMQSEFNTNGLDWKW